MEATSTSNTNTAAAVDASIKMKYGVAVFDAAEEYIARKTRKSHPDGDFDNGMRWYPSKDERCECCDYIREPSRTWPYSLLLHCRTIGHVAELFGVDEKAVRRAAREIERFGK